MKLINNQDKEIHFGSIFKLIFVCLWLINTTASAQEFKPHPLLSPMWQADVEYFAPSKIADSLKNGFIGTSFQFRVPLYIGKDWLSAQGGKPFIAVFTQAGTSIRQTQGNFFDPDRNLTLSKISVTGLYANGPSSLRNLYLLQVGSSLPSESYDIKPIYFRVNGVLVWRHLYHNNRLWHSIGVTYTPINGRDMPLPVLGIGYKINNQNQFSFTFPFNMAYTHLYSRYFSLSVRLNNNGGYYYLRQDSLHQDETLIYRQRYRKLSLVARYYTSRHVVLTPEIGIVAKSTVYINDDKFKQAASVFFKLTMQVRFGKRPPASPILNFDPGDSGSDPSYLIE